MRPPVRDLRSTPGRQTHLRQLAKVEADQSQLRLKTGDRLHQGFKGLFAAGQGQARQDRFQRQRGPRVVRRSVQPRQQRVRRRRDVAELLERRHPPVGRVPPGNRTAH